MNEEASYRPGNDFEELETVGKGPAGVRNWDRAALDNVLKKHVGPLLSKLEGFYRFGVELQTQWESPLGFTPRKIIKESVVIVADEERGQADAEPVADEISTEEDALLDEEADELPEPTSTSAIAMPSIPSSDSAAKTRQTSYLIDPEDLKIFVNSGEWSLSTTLSSHSSFPPNPFAPSELDGTLANETHSTISEEDERTLHFILYLPSPNHRPLRIAKDALSDEASAARGWLIPQWGGVVLHNLDGPSVIDGRTILDSLSEENLDEPFRLFERQLRVLLGLASTQTQSAHGSEEVRDVLAQEALGRRRLLESLRESTQTLASIVRLVAKIENLGVGSDVQHDVDDALHYLSLVNSTLLADSESSPNFGREKLALALQYAHTSASFASRAFFNPNMIGQLYFPDEHKYAVYTPLFGPLAVPLLVSGLRLVKERRQTRKAARELKRSKAQ